MGTLQTPDRQLKIFSALVPVYFREMVRHTRGCEALAKRGIRIESITGPNAIRRRRRQRPAVRRMRGMIGPTPVRRRAGRKGGHLGGHGDRNGADTPEAFRRRVSPKRGCLILCEALTPVRATHLTGDAGRPLPASPPS